MNIVTVNSRKGKKTIRIKLNEIEREVKFFFFFKQVHLRNSYLIMLLFGETSPRFVSIR